ncbi:MAG: nuclear transport factor 2 family protein [Solirubrobacterales bacterium]
MSDQNVELVRRAATAFATGDINQAAEVLDPEVELYPPVEDPDVDRVYRGREGARTWLENWLEAWEEFEFRVDEVVGADERVVVVFSQRGRGKTSGVEIENQLAAVGTLRGGKVVRGELYLDIGEAFRKAGIDRPLDS